MLGPCLLSTTGGPPVPPPPRLRCCRRTHPLLGPVCKLCSEPSACTPAECSFAVRDNNSLAPGILQRWRLCRRRQSRGSSCGAARKQLCRAAPLHLAQRRWRGRGPWRVPSCSLQVADAHAAALPIRLLLPPQPFAQRQRRRAHKVHLNRGWLACCCGACSCHCRSCWSCGRPCSSLLIRLLQRQRPPPPGGRGTGDAPSLRSYCCRCRCCAWPARALLGRLRQAPRQRHAQLPIRVQQLHHLAPLLCLALLARPPPAAAAAAARRGRSCRAEGGGRGQAKVLPGQRLQGQAGVLLHVLRARRLRRLRPLLQPGGAAAGPTAVSASQQWLQLARPAARLGRRRRPSIHTCCTASCLRCCCCRLCRTY